MIIGMLIFPDLTHLDFAGPHEVLTRMPQSEVKVIARSLQPVRAQSGMSVVPDTTMAATPQVDLIFVPGGPGVGAQMENAETLEFLRRQAEHAKYVTSVCTGALVLGAAGLLKGYRATTHWASLDLLPVFGATPVAERVVIDRNRITGGGVTAGIDFGLTVAGEVFGARIAKTIQLGLEYSPAPPFNSGHPSTADAEIVEEERRKRAPQQAARLEQARRAARLYCA
jgi:cyclohexyl-isocyanide hydratase